MAPDTAPNGDQDRITTTAAIDVSAVMRASDEAKAHVHPQRAMRVTLECGHYRLMPQVATIMGIGAITGCQVCSPNSPGAVSRQVVNIEETGVLHDDWFKRRSASPAQRVIEDV